jgi:hypothetical protein
LGDKITTVSRAGRRAHMRHEHKEGEAGSGSDAALVPLAELVSEASHSSHLTIIYLYIDGLPLPEGSAGHTVSLKHCVGVFRQASDIFWVSCPGPWTKHTNESCWKSTRRNGPLRIGYSSASSYLSAHSAFANLPNYLRFFLMRIRLQVSIPIGARRIQKHLYFPPAMFYLGHFCQPHRPKICTVLTLLCERIFDIKSHRKYGTCFPLSHPPQTGAYSSCQSVS